MNEPKNFEEFKRKQADNERTFDLHTEYLKELDRKSDLHTAAFQRVETILGTHTEAISAIQADIASVKATQSDHGEMLSKLVRVVEAHDKRFDGIESMQEEQSEVLREILSRLPEKGA